jgi:hypothetical protein
MFYEKEMEPTLRFGDVVKGYISADITIKQPILFHEKDDYNYKIDIELPRYSVVLTPCCSIGDSVIALAPLVRILGDFFSNPYFEKDITNINREMEPQQALSPENWNKLPKQEQNRRLSEGKRYALLNYFIYMSNEIFEKYALKGHDVQHYMINFKDIRRIKCPLIKRPEKMRREDAIIQSKVLQLSISTRSELRDKIAYFYREPAEDKLLED